MAGPALFLTLDYPPMVGGVANYYSQLVAHLSQAEVVVVDNHDQALTSPWLKTWFVLRRLRQSQPFHSIIVGQVLPLGTVVWLWHMWYRTPYIVYTHGMDITVPQRFWRKRWLLRRILRNAASIVTVSQYSATHLQKLLPKKQWQKIVIIPPGPTITPEIQPLALERSLPSQFFLSVGRLVARKGFDLTLHALAMLPSSLQEWHYVIAGDGPERRRLEELARTLHIEQRVHFFDRLSNGQLVQLYQQSSFLVMPARQLMTGDFEGFGTVILEANTFQKPAIGTRSGGVPDAIIPGQTGLLVEPNHIQQLAEAIMKLATDAKQRLLLGQQAQNFVKQQHQWTSKAQQFNALLKQL